MISGKGGWVVDTLGRPDVASRKEPKVFKVSQKTEYAIRAMVELALREGQGLIAAKDIAERQGIPLRFLEQQLATLHKAGLVESFRGAGGGCRLAREASVIRVADVVDAMEGSFYPMYCLNPSDHTCFQDSRCGLQELWGDVHAAVREVFERTTIAGLARRHRDLAPASPVWSPEELLHPAERAR
jgi:Rrf2 family cysteine metabolism transcriptional repressor